MQYRYGMGGLYLSVSCLQTAKTYGNRNALGPTPPKDKPQPLDFRVGQHCIQPYKARTRNLKPSRALANSWTTVQAVLNPIKSLNLVQTFVQP